MKSMYSPTGWENPVECANTLRTKSEERELFKEQYKHLDLEEIHDAWNRPVFKHSHIDALWSGWKQRAAVACLDGVIQENSEIRCVVNLENLLELIDNYAETRHTCGHWTYNLKSNEARQKVIAALKGNDLS